MSHSSLAVTVSSYIADDFIQLLRTVPDPPNNVAEQDGDISAVWEARNHFDMSNPTYRAVIRFLDSVNPDMFVCEIFSDDGNTDVFGRYEYGFGTERRFILFGNPIDLDPKKLAHYKKKKLKGEKKKLRRK